MELRWAAWQQAIGNSYALFAALILLLASFRAILPAGQLTERDHEPSNHARRCRSGPDTLTSARASPIGSPPIRPHVRG
jgi:hypothetical protein